MLRRLLFRREERELAEAETKRVLAEIEAKNRQLRVQAQRDLDAITDNLAEIAARCRESGHFQQ